MNTKIKFNKEAREALKRGVDTVANAVKVSLGAEGRYVVVPTPQGGYVPTKDGVTIAKSIFPSDNYEAIGAAMIKEASGRTNSEAGDGTTTAAVLTQEIYTRGLELLEKGASPVQLKKGIDQAVKDVVKQLDKSATKVSKKNLKDVTTISVNGDKVLGKLIADAFNKIGEHGIVLTQVSDTKETYIEVKEGLQLDNGFYSDIFITDTVKQECVLDNPLVLLNKGKIEKGKGFVSVLEAALKNKRNLVIITDDMDPFVLSLLAQNIRNGEIKNQICVVRTPQILKIHKDLLGDVAVLSGAKIVSDENGVKLHPNALGTLDKFVAYEGSSFLIGDTGNLSSTIAELTERIKNTDNTIDKKDLQERLSRINGGVATLHIGAQTDSELREKQDRIEDGINATRAALEEGIISGGGVALSMIAFILGTDNNLHDRLIKRRNFLQRVVDYLLRRADCSDFAQGYFLLLSCLQSPYKQILNNAGIKPIFELGKGINVTTGKMVDMIEAGIIDPKKVTRCALENAASVAGTFLTTEAVVARV